MRKVLILVLFLSAFIFNITLVHASPLDNDCLDNKTCIALCNYKTVLTKNRVRNLSIYYHLDSKEISVKYDVTNNTGKVYTKGPGSISYIFSNKDENMYFASNEELSLANFICPLNGYLDTDDLNGNNEFCFDNDGKSCQKKNNMGTSFGKGSTFVSEAKDYDFEDEVAKYSEWIFGDIISDISSGKFNVATDLEKKINTDFIQNFLFGYDMPEFIFNSSAYGSLKENALDEFEKARAKEIGESQREVQNGTKTQEEHQELVDNWNTAQKDVKTSLDNAFASLESQITWLDFDVSDSCQSYLGYADKPEYPAYYLQFSFNLMKYLSILLLGGFTAFDIFKAITSSKEEGFKKILPLLVKRLIIVIIIFFIPILVKFIFELFGIYTDSSCLT